MEKIIAFIFFIIIIFNCYYFRTRRVNSSRVLEFVAQVPNKWMPIVQERWERQDSCRLCAEMVQGRLIWILIFPSFGPESSWLQPGEVVVAQVTTSVRKGGEAAGAAPQTRRSRTQKCWGQLGKQGGSVCSPAGHRSEGVASTGASFRKAGNQSFTWYPAHWGYPYGPFQYLAEWRSKCICLCFLVLRIARIWESRHQTLQLLGR